MQLFSRVLKYVLSFVSIFVVLFLVSELNLVHANENILDKASFYGFKDFVVEEENERVELKPDYKFWGVPEYSNLDK